MYLIYALLTLSALPEQPLPPASYGDGFSERYSVISVESLEFAPDVPLEAEVIVHSPSAQGTVTVLRTDGALVPYEDNIAHLTIENKFGDTLFMRSEGFRTISVAWIGERYVYINKGIGHVVSIEEIYDLVDRKWLVQHTVNHRWP